MAMSMMMPPDSVDSIVTDPPYGLSKEPKMEDVLRHWLNGDDYVHGGAGFMSAAWDSFVPGPSVWREAYRVLKPGGHLVAFFGTRTYDLGVLALRLAGFEIRDQLAWVFGSGFPKSHDVSKGIDKLDAAQVRLDRAFRFTAWIRSQGITARQIDDLTDTKMGSHYTTHPTQPTVATRVLFEMIRPLFREVPPIWLELMVDERTVESENYKSRMVTGVHEEWADRSNYAITSADGLRRDVAPSPEAAQWQGWGTALKPAYEPIVLARKPLVGTVARNVLSHGTGALNIDGCRIEAERPTGWSGGAGLGYHGGTDPNGGDARPVQGRWPANFIHDGSDEATAGFPNTAASKRATVTSKPGEVYGGGQGLPAHTGEYGYDEPAGSAARYFYCAKASKSDRNEGLDDLPEQPSAASEFRPNHTEGAAAGKDGNPYGRWSPVRNNHATVKPTALMQWLVRLVTPPGGTVLDPFTGSGSTGVACAREGFSFIGCEMTAEYVPIIRGRVGYAYDTAARVDHAVNSR